MGVRAAFSWLSGDHHEYILLPILSATGMSNSCWSLSDSLMNHSLGSTQDPLSLLNHAILDVLLEANVLIEQWRREYDHVPLNKPARGGATYRLNAPRPGNEKNKNEDVHVIWHSASPIAIVRLLRGDGSVGQERSEAKQARAGSKKKKE